MTRRDRLAADLKGAALGWHWADKGFWPMLADAALAWLDRNRDEIDREQRLQALWRQHDALERQILQLERTFTDAELAALGAAGAPPDPDEPEPPAKGGTAKEAEQLLEPWQRAHIHRKMMLEEG